MAGCVNFGAEETAASAVERSLLKAAFEVTPPACHSERGAQAHAARTNGAQSCLFVCGDST